VGIANIHVRERQRNLPSVKLIAVQPATLKAFRLIKVKVKGKFVPVLN
jgi:hypothetical protein